MKTSRVLSATDREIPDPEVVARVLAGDVEAFGIVLHRYEAGLLRYATRMLGSPDAAADAVAEGFVRGYRHLRSCRDPARLKSWLYRIVGNRCRSQLARRSAADLPLEDAPPLPDRADPAAEIEWAEQVALVGRAEIADEHLAHIGRFGVFAPGAVVAGRLRATVEVRSADLAQRRQQHQQREREPAHCGLRSLRPAPRHSDARLMRSRAGMCPRGMRSSSRE